MEQRGLKTGLETNLLRLCELLQAGMLFDEDGKHLLADIVMQVGLFDSKMVEALHALRNWKTPRLMECFHAVCPTGIDPITITKDRLNQAIKDAGGCFAKHNRGRKLFMTPRIIDDRRQTGDASNNIATLAGRKKAAICKNRNRVGLIRKTREPMRKSLNLWQSNCLQL